MKLLITGATGGIGKRIIDLAKNKLNWEPKIEINEGLDKTIDYFNNILN